MSARFVKPQTRETLARILESAAEPKAVTQIAEETGYSVSLIKQYSRHLIDEGRMHIGARGARGCALLKAGPGVNVKFQARTAKQSYVGTPYALRLKEALRFPMTASGAAKSLGNDPSSVRKTIRALKVNGEIHISGWERNPVNKSRTAIYAAGPGEDAPYSMTSKPETDDVADPLETRQVRISKAATTGQARRDPFAALLFGEYQGAGA